MHEWIAVIQNAISFSLKRQSSSTLQSPVISKEMPNDLTMLYSIEGNGVCVDCGSKDPDWISKNLGILLCKSCSGIHRGLGTHISKVRSATLDRIDPYLLHFLKNIGNSLSNEVWLAKLEDMSPPKCHDSSREEIEKFTIRKYKDKEFIQRMDQAELQSLLFNAIDNKNYKAIISCIANDADLNRANPNQDGRTALHHAVNLMDIVIIFLLLENGASVDVVEKRGWTPLHYACYRDDPQSVELLIQRRASWLSVDKWGMDPLQLAKKSESLTAEAALQTCIEDLKLQKEKPGVSSDADVGSPPLFQRNSQNGLPSMEGALKGLTQKKHTKVGKFFKGFIKPKGSNPSI